MQARWKLLHDPPSRRVWTWDQLLCLDLLGFSLYIYFAAWIALHLCFRSM